MGKKYLGRNINMFLVLMLIVCISILVGMSTYYSFRYQIIGTSHNEITKELKNTTTNLENAQMELDQLKKSLAETSTDVQKYDELYLGKVSELDETQDELTKTKSELVKTKAELANVSKSYQDEQKVTRTLQIQVANLEDDLKKAENTVDDCFD